MFHSHIIKNSLTEHQSQKKIVNGVLSGSLNDFQLKSVHHMISGFKKHHEVPKELKHGKTTVHVGGHHPKTPMRDGFVSYPGSKHH